MRIEADPIVAPRNTDPHILFGGGGDFREILVPSFRRAGAQSLPRDTTGDEA